MIERKFYHQEKNVCQTSCTWKASFAELKKHPTFSKYLVKLVRQKGFRLVYFTVQFNYTLTQPTYLDSLACYYSFLFSFPHTKWFSVLHSRCYALATWAVAMISIDSINSTSSQGRSIIDSFISRLQGCMLRRLSMPNQLSAMGCQLGRWVRHLKLCRHSIWYKPTPHKWTIKCCSNLHFYSDLIQYIYSVPSPFQDLQLICL